jgi:hypothetical protein
MSVLRRLHEALTTRKLVVLLNKLDDKRFPDGLKSFEKIINCYCRECDLPFYGELDYLGLSIKDRCKCKYENYFSE